MRPRPLRKTFPAQEVTDPVPTSTDPAQLAIPVVPGVDPRAVGYEITVDHDASRVTEIPPFTVEAVGVPALPVVTLSEEETHALREEYGVDVDSDPADEAARDAFVSGLLQALHYEKAALAAHDASKGAEIARIEHVYARRSEPTRRRIRELTRLVEREAMRATFKGKAKSRRVTWGKYGKQQVPTKVEIIDGAALLAHATEKVPEIVKAEVAVPLSAFEHAMAALTLVAKNDPDGPMAEVVRTIEEKRKLEISKSALNAYYAETGDELPGTTVTLAHDVPIVKPEYPELGGNA